MRPGAPMRLRTAVAATGSVGATAAPSARAGAQARPSIVRRQANATAAVVSTTSATANRAIGTAFSRVSRGEVNTAAWNTRIGRKASSTTFGSSSVEMPGM